MSSLDASFHAMTADPATAGRLRALNNNNANTNTRNHGWAGV